MKKILVRYILEIPEERLEKVCKKAMISKNDIIVELRQMAEVHGRTTVYNYLDKIINRRP